MCIQEHKCCFSTFRELYVQFITIFAFFLINTISMFDNSIELNFCYWYTEFNFSLACDQIVFVFFQNSIKIPFTFHVTYLNEYALMVRFRFYIVYILYLFQRQQRNGKKKNACHRNKVVRISAITMCIDVCNVCSDISKYGLQVQRCECQYQWKNVACMF